MLSAPQKKGLGFAKDLFLICCVACRVGYPASGSCRDSHRESGVFSVVSPLSPVESSVPSEAYGPHTSLLLFGSISRKRIFTNSRNKAYTYCLQSITLWISWPFT